MNEDDRRIIISKISGYRQTGSPEENIHITRANRWGTYLILIPVLALMAVLGMFFFAAFLALFAVAALGLGVRFWWMRRKFHQSVQAEEGQSVVIEDAEIIEETKVDREKYK